MIINGDRMQIYMPYMKSLALTMWPGALYTDDNTNTIQYDATAQLHKLSWPVAKWVKNINSASVKSNTDGYFYV